MTSVRLVRYRVFEWVGESVDVDDVGIDFEVITPDNADRVTIFRSPDVARRFASMAISGHLGLFALLEGRVVGHAWAQPASDRSQLVNGYFDLRPGEALIHFCGVDPAFRGRRIFGRLLVELAKRLQDYPLATHVFVDAEASNSASLKGISTSGFKRCFDLTALRVARWVPFRTWRQRPGG